MKDKIILGIDPGTLILGYGLIHERDSGLVMLDCGALKIPASETQPLRLRRIYDFVTAIIEKYRPDEVALEAPFYGKNVQSMLKLGRAQGISMAAAIRFNIPIFEYAPKKVKLAITGNGNASKEQVSSMVMKLLSMMEQPKYLDATDALAVAICHRGNGKVLTAGEDSKFRNWSSFIKDNPGRVQ